MCKISYILTVVFILSCNSNKQNEPVVQKKPSKYLNLLKKYKAVSIDTFKVYSSDDIEVNSFKFKGRLLDSADIMLLPEAFRGLSPKDSSLYACYKFELDSTRTGLITRTPSEYWPSSIKLFILDKKADTIFNYIELAELWGDAGDVMTKTGWIIKDKQKNIQTLLSVNETHYNSAEDETDSTFQSHDYYYLIDLSKRDIDTLSTDSMKLVQQFSKLLK